MNRWVDALSFDDRMWGLPRSLEGKKRHRHKNGGPHSFYDKVAVGRDGIVERRKVKCLDRCVGGGEGVKKVRGGKAVGQRVSTMNTSDNKIGDPLWGGKLVGSLTKPTKGSCS